MVGKGNNLEEQAEESQSRQWSDKRDLAPNQTCNQSKEPRKDPS